MHHKANNPDGNFKMIGDWEGQSRLLKEKFPQVTKTDLVFEKDHEKELLERIQKRLNKKREEMINIRKGQLRGDLKTLLL